MRLLARGDLLTFLWREFLSEARLVPTVAFAVREREAIRLEEESVLVRYMDKAAGPGPGEVIVEIETSAGTVEEVVVHDSLLRNNKVMVEKVHQEENKVLVELPRESAAGNWRIWVFASQTA